MDSLKYSRHSLKQKEKLNIWPQITLLSFVALEVNRLQKNISWYQAKQSIIQHAMRQYMLKPTISLEFG